MADTFVPTPRKICPFMTAGTVNVTTLVGPQGEPPGAKIVPIQCLGPECHLWAYDQRLPAETGDCSVKLSAVFAAPLSEALHQLVSLTAAIAVKAGVEGIKIETPTTPPSNN